MALPPPDLDESAVAVRHLRSPNLGHPKTRWGHKKDGDKRHTDRPV